MAQRPDYRTYERRLLGGHRGDSLAGIRFMVRHSFTAPTFRQFWQRWNPLFSYYLLFVAYASLVKVLPRRVAVPLTFALSGSIHDLAVGLLVGQWQWLFTGVFAGFGMWVVVEEQLGLRLPQQTKGWRWLYHLGLMAIILTLGYQVRALS